MPVVGIREFEALDERVKVLDHAVRDRPAHEVPGACESSRIEFGLSAQHTVDHLVEDLIAPPGAKQPGLGEPDEEIADAGGVEDAGVVDDGKGQVPAPSRSVLDAGVLSFAGQLVEDLAA